MCWRGSLGYSFEQILLPTEVRPVVVTDATNVDEPQIGTTTRACRIYRMTAFATRTPQSKRLRSALSAGEISCPVRNRFSATIDCHTDCEWLFAEISNIISWNTVCSFCTKYRIRDEDMKIRSLSIFVAAVTFTSLTTPAYAFGDHCRRYVRVPVTVALSTGKAAALLYSRFYDHNRFRGRIGPHHYAKVLHPGLKCGKKRQRRRSLK